MNKRRGGRGGWGNRRVKHQRRGRVAAERQQGGSRTPRQVGDDDVPRVHGAPARHDVAQDGVRGVHVAGVLLLRQWGQRGRWVGERKMCNSVSRCSAAALGTRAHSGRSRKGAQACCRQLQQAPCTTSANKHEIHGLSCPPAHKSHLRQLLQHGVVVGGVVVEVQLREGAHAAGGLAAGGEKRGSAEGEREKEKSVSKGWGEGDGSVSA